MTDKAIKAYVVTGTDIWHNGKLFRDGETIELIAADAKRLKDLVTPVKTVKATDDTEKPEQAEKAGNSESDTEKKDASKEAKGGNK